MYRLVAAVVVFIAFLHSTLFATTVIPCLVAENLEETNAWARERVETIGSRFSDPCFALSGGNAPKASEQLNNTHLFLYQKDEKETLPDWLQYHAYIFGIKNVHIIDHQSKKAEVCKLLAMYQYCGVNITYYDGSFTGKSAVLSSVMKKMKHTLIIPLDADEFIVSMKKDKQGTPTGFIMDKGHMLEELRQAPIDGRKYKFTAVHPVRHSDETCKKTLKNLTDTSFGDRRVMSGGYADPQQYRTFMTKGFFYSEGFQATDQGNHFGVVTHDEGKFNNHPDVLNNMSHYYYTMPTLTLVHYLATSYMHLKAKNLRGADAYGFKDGQPCERYRAGSTYCALAHDFRLENALSKEHFMTICKRTKEDSLSMAPFRDWFVRYALSLQELIGE